MYDHRWARVTYAAVTTGIAALCVGLASGLSALIALGGALFVLTGLVVAANLSVIPVRMLSRPSPTGPTTAQPAGRG